jgi:hypothetical protein
MSNSQKALLMSYIVQNFHGQNLKYELLEHQNIHAQCCPLVLEGRSKKYDLQVSARV